MHGRGLVDISPLRRAQMETLIMPEAASPAAFALVALGMVLTPGSIATLLAGRPV
ncbi:hypothetical protein [Rhizobium herbae]|uniref:Uncharacterized protein n=1 Tax=Rhizobium herbae TaxID=508661 RepID=A0ABS4EJ54_9HYPH|nr:hypothetical protein [Rhizobium herbae]MBP1857957.1 hypothetical protein [Rhizobium herbae]